MNLDYTTLRKTLDPQGMWDAILSFSDHFREGWINAADLVPRHRAQDLDHVIIAGMGGSAISGDLLRNYARPESRIPITVLRDYSLPRWVTPRTLVIACSYSGSTAETLSTVRDAIVNDLPIYVVASGGELLDLAHQRDLPHIILQGGLQPRAALGYAFSAVLRIADKLGLVDVNDDDFEEAVTVLRTQGETLAGSPNRAAEIASELVDRQTTVYTGTGLLEAVGVRWRNQIHENAKQLSWGNAFAELNHNEIMGWEASPANLREKTAVIVLKDRDDHPDIARRADVTRGLVESRIATWIEYDAVGKSRLARQLSTVQLGDFVSYYLAMLVGVDPTPVDTIQQLKKTLAS